MSQESTAQHSRWIWNTNGTS